MENIEKTIKPPKNPLTIKINGLIFEYYMDYFNNKYMPLGYTYITTSQYRTPEYNASVKGSASNSAHMFNLARDWVVRKDGKPVEGKELQEFHSKYVKPYWKGYTYAGEKHIHANLSRRISTASTMLAVSAMGLMGINLYSKLTKKKG